jgi:hypothetical protein
MRPAAPVRQPSPLRESLGARTELPSRIKLKDPAATLVDQLANVTSYYCRQRRAFAWRGSEQRVGRCDATRLPPSKCPCYNRTGSAFSAGRHTAEWCNGSTADSGSVSLGSNPSSAAKGRIRLAAQDAALSRRRSRVRIPYAPPVFIRETAPRGRFCSCPYISLSAMVSNVAATRAATVRTWFQKVHSER